MRMKGTWWIFGRSVRGCGLWVAGLLLMGAASQAGAAQIQFDLELELDEVETAYEDYFGPTATLSFVVDTVTAATANPVIGTDYLGALGSYVFDTHNTVSSISLQVTATGGDIYVRDTAAGTDVYRLVPLGLSDNAASETFTDGALTFWGPSGFLSSDALLDDASDFDPISQFTKRQLVFRADGFPSEVAFYDVTSISSSAVTAVPTPGVLMLAGIGAVRARRRVGR